jgi:spore maturation protein CgeB
MGMDFAEELQRLGHTVETFAYRRDNVLYKNKRTKAAYQGALNRRLERRCRDEHPDVVLVIKGGPISADVIGRLKRATGAAVVNVFPDNPLWMMPFEQIEPYDLFFTKERYALRQLELVGLRNLAYLPMYCVPAAHYPVTPSDEESRRWGAPVSFVGNHYPYRERLVRELLAYPLRVWGDGWTRAPDRAVRAIAGPPVFGREKLLVYAASTVSLNHHHPMNDVVGVNTRTFELAAAGACQLVDLKEDLRDLFKPGEEVVAYHDLVELQKQLDVYLAHPDEARAIGANARRRALAEHTLRHRVEEMLATLDERHGRRA